MIDWLEDLITIAAIGVVVLGLLLMGLSLTTLPAAEGALLLLVVTGMLILIYIGIS